MYLSRHVQINMPDLILNYIGFYALPAKDRLRPMYSYNSSSDEIKPKSRGNAFVQIVKEESVEVSAALAVQLQPHSSTIPTDQVPVSRDTINCSVEDGVLSMTPSCSLELCRSKTTHTGCMPCALTVRTQIEGGGAGPLICSPPALSLSLTVITSSTHQESLPPSHTTQCGAQQSSSAKSASHHQGSSSISSNSLYQAQTQLEANMEERLYSGALLLQDDNNRINHSNKHSVKRSTTPTNIPNKPYQTVQGEEFTRKSFNYSNDYFTRWGILKGCRLRGGGESSLAGSATGGWGNSNNNNANTAGWTASSGNNGQQPPSSTNPTQAQQPSQWANSNNNNPTPSQRPSTNATSPQSQQNTGNSVMKVSGNQVSNSNGPQAMQQPSPAPTTQNQPSQQQSGNQPQGQQNGSGTWAQAAGKGLPPSANPTPSTGTPNTPATGTTGTTTKQQLEQLNTMREALFSQDGWGGQHVNQDSGWDIPSSPEPGAKDSNGAPLVPVWKPNVNNGTDLWEANLRNGGQPPPQVAQKTPWGHTPTSNIGGTWGEDDDLGDGSNVWTGVPSGQSGGGGGGGGGGQWGTNNAGPQQPMWGGPKKETDWSGVGGGGGGGGSNWGDPRDPRDMRGATGPSTMDPRSGNDLRSAMVDHRDPMRSVMDHRGMTGNDVMMRGDPRGISGRLNGSASDPMWGGPPQQPPHHHIPHHQQTQPPNKMVAPNAPGVNQWPGPPPKDMSMPVVKHTGWEEPSPPAQRRNIPNIDDGTSLWGSQQQRAAMQGNKVSHWKDMPTAAMGRGMQCPPGMPQNRMAPNASNNMKPETPLWAHPTRNGSWGDGPHEVGGVTPWGEEKVGGGGGGLTPWNDPSLGPSWGGAKPKNTMNQTPWVDAEVDASTWGHPPKQQVPKPLTRELLWASKQFRILSEMGYKKDDIENALRASNMVLEDAMEFLQNSTRGLSIGDAWRGARHADMEPQFDHPNPQAFPSQRLNQQLPFAPPGGTGSGPNLLNNTGNQSLSNISPAIVQKIMIQQPPPQQPTAYNQSRTPQNQPSAQQLRMLVQQIQMAVQTGYLNHQILNQPLAPQTLILLNQLLQQIKHLQQAMQQQGMLQVPNPLQGGGKAQISVQIAKAKQSISNLQNQIVAQQAIYMKQQLHHMPPHQGDFFKPNVPDPISALQSNFNEMTMNKEPQHSSAFQSQQQSRLNQWKLPSLDKDGDMSGGNEFSRAPGTTTKSQGGNSSPNLNPLLGQGDGTWSSVTRSNSDTGWPDSSNVETDNKDWPVATSQSNSQAFTDLVPEFEPGKPWKGTQMKSIEDDPSITPGSVVRSPLSLATIKDTDVFTSGGKTSPTVSGVDMPIPPLSLSSSTWSFNPPSSTSSSFSSPLGKLGVAKNTWGEAPPPTVSNELWSVPKSRGPPPGLSSKMTTNPGNGGIGGSSNGWGSLGSRWGGGGGGPQQSQSSWGSTWLLLKNLTPQIDGSTLKTLCVQHGPLSNFHLYLNHGIAVAKYSTRDEASKAQGALNNCVLSNTTIFAESLVDNEAQSLLQHLGQQSSGGGGWGLRGGSTPGQGSGPKGAPPGGDTWGSGSQLWAPSNSGGSSLWGPPPLDNSDQHRATPSSLNSFLPGDLLGSNDTIYGNEVNKQ